MREFNDIRSYNIRERTLDGKRRLSVTGNRGERGAGGASTSMTVIESTDGFRLDLPESYDVPHDLAELIAGWILRRRIERLLAKSDYTAADADRLLRDLLRQMEAA